MIEGPFLDQGLLEALSFHKDPIRKPKKRKTSSPIGSESCSDSRASWWPSVWDTLAFCRRHREPMARRRQGLPAMGKQVSWNGTVFWWGSGEGDRSVATAPLKYEIPAVLRTLLPCLILM